MGDSEVQTEAEQPPPAQIPLLNSSHQNDTAQNRQQQEIRTRNDLDDSLEKLERFLSFLGFNQSSLLSFSLSWAAFSMVGVLVPVLVLELSKCDGCETYQIKDFEMDIVASQACLAAVSLFCISFNLRKYGIRRFLFVDRYGGQMARFTNLYVKQISDSIHLLIWWLLPCFILKTVCEIIRSLYVQRNSWWISVAILLALILSWTFVSTISLSASILFHLVCNLQVIHFDDYAKLLEREFDVLVLIEEHIRLRHHLSKISHRFRIFLLLEFLVVTASQFVTLFQTTGYGGMINFINGGDFAVSSIVQVVGIILCLHAATKISHRAQGIASLASRWHALATCTSTDESLRGSNSVGNMEAFNQLNSLHLTFSESDLESVDYVAMPTTMQLASYMSSYHRRQAFVMYLQGNPGGITIFGWTVDRGLINTIFFIELSLVTFVLGKTIVFSST
ncbi:uncharacterized protein LOC111317976 isoform X1 [Durio zibethinus]|uniref:Uncharacterized protein LOC111317976 isoform X1 n=1 Tax=Durio zibethinus TaxID=66656 RepID=A0A6P6BGP4_DURZI|nr:uncharacterized protein LOC111317976 isoform X1 [Durio zibethinus]